MSVADRATGAIPALLPGVVVCVAFPVLYYAENGEFLIDARGAVDLFAAALLCWTILVSCIAAFGGKFAGPLCAGLFWLGIYILVADIVAPISVGPLAVGDELENIAEPLRDSLLQLAVAVAVTVTALLVRWGETVRTIATIVVLTIVAVNGVSLGRFIIGTEWTGHGGDPGRARGRAQGRVAGEEDLAGRVGNVYHLVFDEHGASFEELAAELGVLGEFDGFTHFSDTLANSVFSELSIPSFMSGTLPDANDMRAWKKQIWKDDIDLLSIFRAAGYRVSVYQSFFGHFTNADYRIGPADLPLGQQKSSDSVEFVDHVLLRVAPAFLRQEMFVDGSGLVSRYWDDAASADVLSGVKGLRSAAPRSVVAMRRLLRDEPTRPESAQYVYAHFMLPHGPYFLDRQLTVKARHTSYREQSLASVNMMVMFLDQLERSGRYEAATIVIQGDHGESGPTRGIPGGLIKSPDALLLIKRPGDSGPLRVSRYPAQLLDVAPTLYAIAGLDVGIENGGTDLFAAGKTRDRDIHILNYRNQNKRGSGYRHLIRRAGAQWIEMPDLPNEGNNGLVEVIVTVPSGD